LGYEPVGECSFGLAAAGIKSTEKNELGANCKSGNQFKNPVLPLQKIKFFIFEVV
jgi:hypothetical protein